MRLIRYFINIIRLIPFIVMLGYLTACSGSGNNESTSNNTGTSNSSTTTASSTTATTSTAASSTTNTTSTTSTTTAATGTSSTASTTPASNTLVSASTGLAAATTTPTAAATTSTSPSTGSNKFKLVSSQGVVMDPDNLTNGAQTIAVGSSGISSRPDLEGADMTPLTSTDLAARQLQTSAAATQESILGFDSRYHVNPYSYPERAVVSITYNGMTHCTGWLISKDTVVTAGHCVHGGGSNGRWGVTSSFRFFPGFADGYAPYGSCGAKEIYSSYGWIVSADTDSDVGLIKLDCTIGNTTGYFSYFVANTMKDQTVTINGYPGDKADATQQWASQGTVQSETTARYYYDNDTSGGMSGSPVWLYGTNDSVWAVAIHTLGEDALHPGTNSGVRINQDVFDLITAVKNLP